MGCTLMKIDKPIVKVFFRKLKKITPEYTMYAGCRGMYRSIAVIKVIAGCS